MPMDCIGGENEQAHGLHTKNLHTQDLAPRTLADYPVAGTAAKLLRLSHEAQRMARETK